MYTVYIHLETSVDQPGTVDSLFIPILQLETLTHAFKHYKLQSACLNTVGGVPGGNPPSKLHAH